MTTPPSRAGAPQWETLVRSHGASLADAAVIVVDHGSRRAESNAMLVEVAALFRKRSPFAIVEPAHMEIAEPSIQRAFDQCVARGARLVIISPFFLLPGQHWTEDIPKLAAQAAASHSGVRYVVAEPLGLHDLLVEVMLERIRVALGEEA